jgi:hypothetical protein
MTLHSTPQTQQGSPFPESLGIARGRGLTPLIFPTKILDFGAITHWGNYALGQLRIGAITHWGNYALGQLRIEAIRF